MTHRVIVLALAVILCAVGTCFADQPSLLGILQGVGPIANDQHGLSETLGRYQRYEVLVPGAGFRGRLTWRGMGPFREYDVWDAHGRRAGSIEYFGMRFGLYDRDHRRVGEIGGAWGFNGRYEVRDDHNQVVGTMDSPFGDGLSFNIRGGVAARALFARIGLEVAGATTALRHPVPEAGRMIGTLPVAGTSTQDTLRRFAHYEVSAGSSPRVGSLTLSTSAAGLSIFAVRDSAGVVRGAILGRVGVPRFDLVDASNQRVGTLTAEGPAGELHVHDATGADVGALVDFSGDGAVISVRGGDACAAVFARIGLKLVPPGKAAREAARAARYRELTGS